MPNIVELRGVSVEFPGELSLLARLRGRKPEAAAALDNVNLAIKRGEAVGIVGELGCGKSTLARVLVGLVPPTKGEVLIGDQAVGKHRDKSMRQRVQMVFQDPSSSLNPSRTIEQTLSELLRVHKLVPKEQIQARCAELLEQVRLPISVKGQHPMRLSGGQRQRVGIARALSLEPEVLIADESVAALDVSVQAAVLNLFLDLKRELDLTLLFISHDLAVIRHVCERVVVIYLGRIVEEGPAIEVFQNPGHPYTRALIAAAPSLETRKQPGTSALSGEAPLLGQLPTGCRFHPRCPYAQDICRAQEPPAKSNGHHEAACHFAWVNQ